MGENIKEKVSKSPTNVELVHKILRGHTNLELCKCRFKFSWISVYYTLYLVPVTTIQHSRYIVEN